MEEREGKGGRGDAHSYKFSEVGPVKFQKNTNGSLVYRSANAPNVSTYTHKDAINIQADYMPEKKNDILTFNLIFST